MIVLRTRNSLYALKATGAGFIVRKVQELRPGAFMAVGEERFTTYARIQVGQRAVFDVWSTSPVEAVLEPEADGPPSRFAGLEL